MNARQKGTAVTLRIMNRLQSGGSTLPVAARTPGFPYVSQTQVMLGPRNLDRQTGYRLTVSSRER